MRLHPRHGLPSGLLFILVLVCALYYSCAPRSEVDTVPVERHYPQPSELTVKAGDRSALLVWKTNRAATTVIRGYHVYLSKEEGQFRLLTESPYPGDEDPSYQFETFPLEGLDNGVIYKAYVTTLFPANVESKPTNVVEFVPRFEGMFELTGVYSGSTGGFSFELNQSVGSGELENDLYLAQIDGQLYLASPHRLYDVLHRTRFYNLGVHNNLLEAALTNEPAESAPLATVRPGEVILVQTQTRHFALVHIEKVDRTPPRILISYLYQPREGLLRFH